MAELIGLRTRRSPCSRPVGFDSARIKSAPAQGLRATINTSPSRRWASTQKGPRQVAEHGERSYDTAKADVKSKLDAVVVAARARASLALRQPLPQRLYVRRGFEVPSFCIRDGLVEIIKRPHTFQRCRKGAELADVSTLIRPLAGNPMESDLLTQMAGVVAEQSTDLADQLIDEGLVGSASSLLFRRLRVELVAAELTQNA